jgi:hypothetical protein
VDIFSSLYIKITRYLLFSKRLFIGLVLLISAHSLYAQHPEGDLRTDQTDAMKPQMGKSASYYETWTYHILLDNDIYLIYEFNITDFGSFKDRVSGAKYQISGLGKTTYVTRKEYNVSTFTYDSTLNLIELNPERAYWARGNFDQRHYLSFDGNKNGIHYLAKLELFDIAPSYIWGDGLFRMNGNHVGLSFPIPHAKVKGTIAIDEDSLEEVRGIAFMDHLHLNNKVTNLFSSGYRIKIGDQNQGVILNVMQPLDEEKLVGYGIAFHHNKGTLIKPERLEYIEKGKVRGTVYAKKLKIYFKQREPLIIEVDQIDSEYSILDELGGIQKFFAKKYLGGEVIEFNGRGRSDTYSQPVVFNYYIIK